MNENYYLVETMCGHVGNRAYIPVTFPVIAENARSAAKLAREIPRVKHHNKYAILGVKKVEHNEYVKQQQSNKEDRYLNWKKCDQEEYLNEVMNRTMHMDEERDHKESTRMETNNHKHKKSTTIRLCVQEDFVDPNYLLGSFSTRKCRIF